MSISLNIHHAKRIKNNRKKYWMVQVNPQNPRHVGKATKTPRYCTCIYCTNQKHMGEVTRKQMRMDAESKVEDCGWSIT